MNRVLTSMVLMASFTPLFAAMASVDCQPAVVEIADAFGAKSGQAIRSVRSDGKNFVLPTSKGNVDVKQDKNGRITLYKHDGSKHDAFVALKPAPDCSIQSITFYRDKDKIELPGATCYQFAKASTQVDENNGGQNPEKANREVMTEIKDTYLFQSKKQLVTENEAKILQRFRDNCRNGRPFAAHSRNAKGFSSPQEAKYERNSNSNRAQ